MFSKRKKNILESFKQEKTVLSMLMYNNESLNMEG